MTDPGLSREPAGADRAAGPCAVRRGDAGGLRDAEGVARRRAAKGLKGLASSELTGRVTREAEVKARSARISGLEEIDERRDPSGDDHAAGCRASAIAPGSSTRRGASISRAGCATAGTAASRRCSPGRRRSSPTWWRVPARTVVGAGRCRAGRSRQSRCAESAAAGRAVLGAADGVVHEPRVLACIHRRSATSAQIASTTPNGHAPCRKP